MIMVISMEDTDLKKKFRDVKTKFIRAFGFGYPHTLIVLHDNKDEEVYIENPRIEIKEIEISKKKYKNSIIHDEKTHEVYQIRGDLKKYLKPYRIVDYYPEAAASLLLPGFIIYTAILLWAFGVITMSTIWVMIFTFLLAMMLFQGKYVYTEGNIQAVDCAYKGHISGFKLYVPMHKDFLDLEPSDDKSIIKDSIKRLVSFFKPVLAENQLLTEQIQKMADGYSKSFLLGLRMRKGYMDLSEKYPAWIWALIGVVIGIIIGLVISGGVAPAPGGAGP